VEKLARIECVRVPIDRRNEAKVVKELIESENWADLRNYQLLSMVNKIRMIIQLKHKSYKFTSHHPVESQ
jgi:hypothetical protein